MRRNLQLVVAGLAVSVSVVRPAAAIEYCVTCAGPDATYRCAVEGAPEGRPQTAAQIRCISEIAKAGAHQNCSVSRNHSGPCEGQLHTVTLENMSPGPAPADQTAGAPSATANPAGVAPVVTPPGTLLAPTLVPPEGTEQQPETAANPDDEKASNPVNDAARAAGQSIENAGHAVGDAARKSWDCVTSLFRGC